MNIAPLLSLTIALIALVGIRFALPFLLKGLKAGVQENITTLVLSLAAAYVAIYYVIIPLSRVFGVSVWLP